MPSTPRPASTMPARRARPRPWRTVVTVSLAAALLSGCGLFAQPQPRPPDQPSLAPGGAVGYVVCPTAVTPVELASATPEADIALPIEGQPSQGNAAIAVAPDGRRGWVVTSSGSAGNVVVPLDLVAQRAGRPIPIPGNGETHAIVTGPDGRTVYAASGTTVVPITADTGAVGSPIRLGEGRRIFGLALAPALHRLFALVPDGVVPIDLEHGVAGPMIVTHLTVSSVAGPHGIALGAHGGTVYVVGDGGPDYGGRITALAAATGAVGASGSFAATGLAGPAAVVTMPGGKLAYVLDTPNGWITPVPLPSLVPAPPIRLPATPGIQHPTDMVLGYGGATAYVVAGFDAVVPFVPATRAFGTPIPVCSGASSMAIGPAP